MTSWERERERIIACKYVIITNIYDFIHSIPISNRYYKQWDDDLVLFVVTRFLSYIFVCNIQPLKKKNSFIYST